ncbi:MAG TPA: alpha/beta fold hydrolase [Actinophytocola sp.]|uniref:alpha/beta fold hydrolase n=1 Tax=Actinophytocola sp. TaxID=1872138 RepID=UPI002DDCE275|nr:alpha/beta fold hydrolase [Actinophytocola sp.]HEV2780217.1 alpha/beta fold hydrolase [Actinophytocola sp.]
MSETLSDGTAINLVRAGDPDAELTVVLVHSYAQDLRIWHKVLEILPRATERPIQVLAYDHRGHGESGPADEATATVERLGDDLAELVRLAVPRGRVVLTGHGMGGLVCMALTARQPELFTERVAGLVFLSTPAGRLAEASATLPQSVGRLVRDLEAILGSRLLDHVRNRIDKATTIGLRWLLLGDDPDPADTALVAHMISKHWPDTVALFLPALDRYAREVALTVAAGTPVLAVVGDRDRLVPAAHARALAGSVQSGTAVVLPGVGHMLPLEGSAEIIPRMVGLVHAVLRAT